MPWAFKVGTIAGTAIRLHVTFLLLLLWIGIAHYLNGGWPAALEGVTFIALLFLCVLAHEFGHIFAARGFGITTPDVILLPIGGVASLERIPERPREELLIALAGPAVNIVIAVVLVLWLGALVDPIALARLDDPGISLVARLAAANLFIALFNMIPAFPMDGGRVLRALLATRMGRRSATRLAARIGQGLAFVFGFAGLFFSPILVFIGIFVYLAATSEAALVEFQDATRGTPVIEAAMTRFERLSPEALVGDAVSAFLATSQREFPVLDGHGRLAGLLTFEDTVRALKDGGSETPIAEFLRTDIPLLHRRRPLEEAMRLIEGRRMPAVAVVDEADRLVGLVTAENLGELVVLAAAQRRENRPGWGAERPMTVPRL